VRRSVKSATDGDSGFGVADAPFAFGAAVLVQKHLLEFEKLLDHGRDWGNSHIERKNCRRPKSRVNEAAEIPRQAPNQRVKKMKLAALGAAAVESSRRPRLDSARVATFRHTGPEREPSCKRSAPRENDDSRQGHSSAYLLPPSYPPLRCHLSFGTALRRQFTHWKERKAIREALMPRRTKQRYRFHLSRVVFARANGDHEPLHPGQVNEFLHVWLAGAEGMPFAPAGLQIEAFEFAEAIVEQLRDFSGVAVLVPSAGFAVTV
jgi:hypothetical protein